MYRVFAPLTKDHGIVWLNRVLFVCVCVVIYCFFVVMKYKNYIINYFPVICDFSNEFIEAARL